MPACALLILILLKEHSNEVWNEKMIEYLNEKVNSLQSGGPASSLVAPTKPGEPSSALIAVLQIMWFVASAGAFYFLGGGGEHLEALQETHRHHQSGDEVSAPPQVSEPFQSDGEE